MRMSQLGLIVLVVALAGCATSDLPRGARFVGGGLMVDYEAPTDGTAILIERTSRRIVATESLSEGSSFRFGPGWGSCDEVLFRMFAHPDAVDVGGVVVVPTNAFFQLYFVPEKARKE
jgi:hypothetical protein